MMEGKAGKGGRWTLVLREVKHSPIVRANSQSDFHNCNNGTHWAEGYNPEILDYLRWIPTIKAFPSHSRLLPRPPHFFRGTHLHRYTARSILGLEQSFKYRITLIRCIFVLDTREACIDCIYSPPPCFPCTLTYSTAKALTRS